MPKEFCSNLLFCVNLGLLALSFVVTKLNESAKWQIIAGFKYFFSDAVRFSNQGGQAVMWWA
jgi:hypothetical protein